MEYALERGIKKDFFTVDREGEVYQLILDHHSHYGKVPDVEAVQLAYDDYPVTEQDESLHFYADRVADDRLKKIVTDEGELELAF